MRWFVFWSMMLLGGSQWVEAGSLHEHAKAGRTQEVVNLALLQEAAAAMHTRNAQGETPLYLAARYCGVEAVRALLFAQAGVNLVNADGSTSLHGVARSIQKEASQIAALLIEKGADVHALDGEERTPLHVAAMNQPHVTRMLLGHEAAVNHVDKQGRTALHWAAETGNASCAKLLIAAGAKLDVRAPNSGTALHRAVFSNKPELCRLLLSSGAKVTIRDALNNTPLKLALKLKRVELIQMLVDAGAEE